MRKNVVYGIEAVESLYRKANQYRSEAGDQSLHPEEQEFLWQRAEYYLVKAWNLLCSLKCKSVRGRHLFEEIGWDVHTIEGVGY
jgi:hypothetical protein